MSAALAPPFVVAGLLLCVAGALKLRSPSTAAGALQMLGLPDRARRVRALADPTWLVRAVAAGELVLGAVCAVHPSRASAVVLTGAYATFAGVAAALARRRAACGCFGEDETPVSAVHWMASAVLGAVAAAAAAAGPHGVGWVLGQPGPTVAVLILGIAGALYATVLVYTQLPAAWAAWSGQ